MIDLTDLEVKVAVAKIHLGSGYDIHKYEDTGFVGYLPVDCVGKLTEFDPFDDALTWKLMIKYKIKLDWEYDNTWVCFKNGISKQLSKDKSSNKSVCLAVIELAKIEKNLKRITNDPVH